MKVCVEVGIEGEYGQLLAAELAKNWTPFVSFVSPRQDLPGDVKGLLVLGKGRTGRLVEGLLLVERIEGVPPTLEEAMFQTNARLGRMIRSDLMKADARASLGAGGGKISRRDLFLRLRGETATYSDAPVVLESVCEAKFGCTKCVDVCPSKALKIEGARVLVNEEECTRGGECTSTCPVSAIQLPRFSEDSFKGLLNGLKLSASRRKILVLACMGSRLDPEPWVFVEKVKDIGAIGPRQLAMAAGSGLAGVIVYCEDGQCRGVPNARLAAQSLKSILRTEDRVAVEFLQGEEGKTRIKEIRRNIDDRDRRALAFGKGPWGDYTQTLRSLSRPGAPGTGLGLTDLEVDDTCTLCGVCARSCPHTAIRMSTGLLEFDSAECTGCGYCAHLCPEGSITLRPLAELSGLALTTVFRDDMVSCARCGKPLESAKLLKKVSTLLGKEDPLMKYCPSCKQVLAFENLTKKDWQEPPGP
jgi:ferredoxin